MGSRHWSYSRRHHGQEKPKARSQKGPERASGESCQGEEAGKRSEEGEEGRVQSGGQSPQAQGRQGRRSQGAQGQDRRRKALTPARRGPLRHSNEKASF